MNLDEIKQRWKSERKGSAKAAKQWDAMASSFYNQPIASFANDELLNLLSANGMLQAGGHVLDLGCGTGKYGLPLAQHAGHVVAIDVSAVMLEAARAKGLQMGLGNIEFIQADWHDINIEEAGWKGTFDLSIAWLSPAVHDYDSFEKFAATSRGWCVLGNHLRRDESLSDRFRATFALPEPSLALGDISWAVAVLLQEGKKPFLAYVENEWERTSSFDELYLKYKRRLEAGGVYNKANNLRLHSFLQKEMHGAKSLDEHLSATIGVVYWRV